MHQPICIGFVGENGAGKSTALKLIRAALPELTAKELRFSGTLSATLKLWGIEENRANLQLLAQVMDNAYGKGTLSRALIAQARNMQEQLLFLDGVRWPSDEEAIRSFEKHLIIYVTASPKTRFKRLVGRNEKSGEGNMTWEQFEREDRAPNELYIRDIGSRAEVIIEHSVNGLSIVPALVAIKQLAARR